MISGFFCFKIENLYKYKVWQDYKTKDLLFRGKISGVTEFGHLQILTPEDELKEFDFKEVEFHGCQYSVSQ